MGFEFGVGLLNGVKVGAVSGQEEDVSAACLDKGSGGGDFVGGEVVEDDDVAGLELWAENLAQVGGEGVGVHGAGQQKGCGDAIVAQCGDERGGAPVAVRFGAGAALTHGGAAVTTGHFRVEAGFVEEDQPAHVPGGLLLTPALAGGDQVRSVALDGVRRFF